MSNFKSLYFNFLIILLLNENTSNLKVNAFISRVESDQRLLRGGDENLDYKNFISNIETYRKCKEKIKSLAFDKNVTEEKIFRKYLEIHDYIMSFHETTINIEELMIKNLFKLLQKVIKLRKSNKNGRFHLQKN